MSASINRLFGFGGRIKRLALLLALALTVLVLNALFVSAEGPSVKSTRQFVVIVFDDMRVDDMQYLPRLASLTARSGQSLDNAFIACPLCCPSRSSLMTGLMPSRHGVTNNPARLLVPTIFPALHNAQIKTGLIGKYLNSHDGRPLPEFDYWASFRAGNVRDWLRPRMNINGTFKTLDAYISDVVLEHAQIFTSRYAQDPYVLYMNFTAPHRPATVPKQYSSSCTHITLPASFNEIDSSAPELYRSREPLSRELLLEYACDRSKSLKYLDHKITKFVKDLARKGVTVFVVSDNGVMLGEYRMREKGYPYPQVVRTPFLAFNYPHIDPNRVISLIDIPVTILKAFNVAPLTDGVDGIALDEPRTSAAIEYFDPITYDAMLRIPFEAEATPGLVRVTYLGGFTQDLRY